MQMMLVTAKASIELQTLKKRNFSGRSLGIFSKE